MRGDPPLEVRELGGIAVEEVELVLRGPDRTLHPAQRIAREQLVEALVGREQLLGCGGEPLAQGGGLRCHVVRPAGDDCVVVLPGERREPDQRSNDLVPHQQQAVPHLELLDVLREVARRHALVDLLLAGQGVELLDARLDVVPSHALARSDRGEVDALEHFLVGLHSAVWYLNPELCLCPEHREPQLTLKDDLVLGRPQLGHRWRRIAAGEHVGQVRLRGHGSILSHLRHRWSCCRQGVGEVRPPAPQGRMTSPRTAARAMSPRCCEPASRISSTAS